MGKAQNLGEIPHIQLPWQASEQDLPALGHILPFLWVVPGQREPRRPELVQVAQC